MEVPIGTIMAFAGPAYFPKENVRGIDEIILKVGLKNVETLAATGWLPCTGWYLKTADPQFKDLYNMIVYFWGESDQQKLFKIPDLQGLFLRGVSGTSNRDPDANNRTAISYGGAIRNMVGSFQNSGTYLDNLYRSLFDTFCQGTVRADELSFGKAMGVKYKLGDNETRPVNAYVTYIIKASNNPINLKTVYKAKPKKEKKADK